MSRFNLPSQGEPNRLHALKGLAILIYLTSHFRAVCWAEDRGVLGYSNAAVGLFFLASGYGLFHSLARRLGEGASLAAWAGRFWRDRLIRLYPQYVLALALMPLLFGKTVAWWQVLGVDSPYWTIGQALQCYALAPLLFALAHSGSRAVRWLPLAGIVGCNALALALAGEIDRSGMLNQFVYRHLYGTHLALFHLGMLAAARPSPWAARLSKAGGLGLATMWLGALLVCGVSLERMESAVRGAWAGLSGWAEQAGMGAMAWDDLDTVAAWIAALLTGVCVAASCTFFQAYLVLPRMHGTEGRGAVTLRETVRGTLPGSRFLALLGRNSLSIYLFEPVFYLAMFKLSLLEVRRWKSILWFAAMSPVMFAACAGIQRIQGAALRKLTGRA